jgi:alkylated DNA repair dioxygenase AlkB
MNARHTSPTLFPMVDLPEGFSYAPDFLSREQETELRQVFKDLPFGTFDFHGYIARRRVVEYGLEYDFSTRRATPTQQIPDFIVSIRERAAQFAGLTPPDLVEAMVTEYPPGAPIGWHRDAPQFGTIIGISLCSEARMRFKPYRAEGKAVSLLLEPRSIYAMRGPARWGFQHSIPAGKETRYSITLRSLRYREGKNAPP